jgi:hypothetical protein
MHINRSNDDDDDDDGIYKRIRSKKNVEKIH